MAGLTVKNQPKFTPRWQAIGMLTLATLFWGLSFPLIKALVAIHGQLLPGSSTWSITACTVGPRFLLAAVVLGCVLIKQWGTFTLLEIRQGVLLGLSAGAGMFLQNDGLQFTSASVSAFLTQLYAILIPAYLALRARRWPGATVWTCSGLVLAGVAVLGRFDFRELRLGRGEMETLASSVFFMMQILLLGQKRYAANRMLPVTLVMFVVQALLFGGLAVKTMPRASDWLVLGASGWWLLCTGLLTVFSTLGSFILMNQWQPKITPTEAGLIYCIEPLFASVLALFLPGLLSACALIAYPNESLTWHLLLGGGLITAANILLQLAPPEKS